MPASRHRMALVTWLVVYPMITSLLAVLEPILGNLAMPLRTLVLTSIMVPAMIYVAMPAATAWLVGWLTKANKNHCTSEYKGLSSPDIAHRL